jgi:acyl-homoserine lactone acylase PvdQ
MRYAAILLAFIFCLPASAEDITIYYDDFGIPHIYADTAEAGLYGQGWAMASDRLVQTLENYLRGMGRFSAAYGPGEKDANVRADLMSLMWDHYGVSKKNYKRLPKAFRKHNQAFVDGMNAWMNANPEGVPEWWVYGDVDVYMPVAFSRQFIWGWPAGEAADDLEKAGLKPDYDIEFPYSNEMAIAPHRTTFGAAALIIDPHLGWFGRQRYWECRIHAGDVHISGFATAGFPYVNLGHNEHVAWAHTTGGPDTSDVYVVDLNPENSTEYLYDGEYRKLTTKEVSLPVKGEADRDVTFYYTQHGPVIAQKDGKAYAAKLAYADEVGYLESKYYFMIAKDYADVIDALKVCQIMPQNVMVADTKGNIYYQRTGRVPIRPAGFDFSAPVNGSISKTEWLGLHGTEDFVQVLNPPQGYMQNCNITPDVMMVDSPMTPDKYPGYIFNQPEMYTHQRATRAVEILHNNDKMSVQDILDLALDKKVYQFERWKTLLSDAFLAEGDDADPLTRSAFNRIREWNGESTRDSNGALAYYYWRDTVLQTLGREKNADLIRRVNHYLDIFGVPEPEHDAITREELGVLMECLKKGAERMNSNHGSLDAVFGDVFRAGRLDYDGDDVSYPVGGGSLRREGMATLRAIGFTPPREDHTRWGTGGQTSTEVIIMTNPIQSFTQPPIGQSDHPDSPHFRDQAEKLMSGSKLKPSWFQKKDLMDGHVKSTVKVKYPG